MPIHIVRLGSPRLPNEGLRIGTVPIGCYSVLRDELLEARGAKII
ncbi:hypothetical protein [Pseudomonas sp. PD9R]|nr:hypothetical protein [Pseudomonas sp. PD9R]